MRRHLRIVVIIALFVPYWLVANPISPVTVIFAAMPIVGRLGSYLRKKYIASRPPSVDRVGNDLVIRGVVDRVSVDINNVESLHVGNTIFSRIFDLKVLTIQTLHDEQIRILITLEDAQRMAIVMA